MTVRPASDAAPPAAVSLRRATTADVARIGEIERASFADPWSDASLRSLVGAPRAWFVVAEADQPPGVLGYFVGWVIADEAEIANLAVDPAHRGHRIGTQLLDGALAAAADQGATAVYLEVRASNAGAQRLYASRGFEVVARRRGYYRRPLEDALVLRRRLAPSGPPG